MKIFIHIPTSISLLNAFRPSKTIEGIVINILIRNIFICVYIQRLPQVRRLWSNLKRLQFLFIFYISIIHCISYHSLVHHRIWVTCIQIWTIIYITIHLFKFSSVSIQSLIWSIKARWCILIFIIIFIR
jgi:hypothetical protein